MALERKPAQPEANQPGYPTADEYAGDRRTFLAMVGVTAAAAVGLYALKGSRMFGSQPEAIHGGTPAQPQAVTLGEPPALPQAATGGKPMPAQPLAAPPGEAAAPEYVPARPQAAELGDVAAPAPVRPQASPAGSPPPVETQPGEKPTAAEPVRPQLPVPGGIRPVQPQSQVEGGTRAPAMPAANAKGSGERVVRRADPKAQRTPQPPQTEEDF